MTRRKGSTRIDLSYRGELPVQRVHGQSVNISDSKEMKWVYGDSLTGTADLLQEQLQLAKATSHGYSVKVRNLFVNTTNY